MIVHDDKKINARDWLKANGYSDVAEIIEAFMEYTRSIGSGERRNYWDLLAGRKDGQCFQRHGFTFPILETVRSTRKPNYKPTSIAIKRNKVESVPSPIQQQRWNKDNSNIR